MPVEPPSQPRPWKPTTYPNIHNPPYPADGPGNQTFDNSRLIVAVLLVPAILIVLMRWSFWLYPFVLLFTTLPTFGVTFYYDCRYAPSYYNRVQLPGKNVEDYIEIKDENLKEYKGKNRIPMELFFENYAIGNIDIKSDALEIMEARHDWACFHFTMGQFKFFVTQWIPELLWHSKIQDQDQVREHYDRGDDFYAAFLGDCMVYTAGIMSDPRKEETLEELQYNKLKLVCEKTGMNAGDKHLDIGCGWGTLVAYSAKHYQTDSTGVTLGQNQTAFGNDRCREWGVADRARLLAMDYRDIPKETYQRITCQMAEHVGVRRFNEFLCQVRSILDDDGVFYMQVAGLRNTWQYEDFIWGLFMAKYIFPGADASTPLYWYISKLEAAGFEVQTVDTVGVHYSATIYRWYKNWISNKDAMMAKYGQRWYRIWEMFLAWSTIISRQGSATCFMITAHKNRNSFDRAGLAARRPLLRL